ncbi:MAG: hypothetical protein AVDCRST_MAG34-1595 [uncultured Nocardioidaceae bacterium]|uniref:HTH luxR-type domain-containing protein n=1 Tax=uncultured Nocardioidaceae bacterium TaxID=253824 RepID=A0A6J4M861_9ACTN|nr:MAG: hypothetical protein AVDCRST_MAG34-1595 [uncultured Nocardioidaceae bacterium]
MPSQLIVDPPHELLGRSTELSLLMRHTGLAGAPPGRSGGAVLLAGDAGIGKTRLLTELSARAEAGGWRVMVGHCLDFADQLLPYLPFSEIFGRLADHDPELAERVLRDHPAVRALTPGRRLMSGTGAGDGDDDRTEDLDRAAIFVDLHAALETLAEEGPVLVVVEDLHWADQSTRDLLSFLFTRPFRGQVGIVGSYRSDDLHRRHPLRTAVAEWGRLPAVHRVQLPPLPDDLVRRLVRALHDGPLHERDVAWIVDRAEGNAFFTEELVGSGRLDDGDGALPEQLADLLLVRLDRLDDASRQVVRAASCAGRRVTHRLLEAVVGLPGDELERGLRAAVESHVLVRVGSDSYAFRHALLAEAVYADLLPGERVRLHGRYVEALTANLLDSTAAELATHARASFDVDTAIRAGVQAGEEAMAVGGPDDAAKHFEAVLEILARPSTVVPDGVALTGLVSRASEAFVASGHPGRAMALVRDHLDQAPSDLPPRDRARLLMAWAAALLLTERPDDPTEATREALELVGEQPSPLRTRAQSLHARALARQEREDEAAKHAGEALAMAQRFDLGQVATEAMTTLATLDVEAGDTETAVRALERVVDAAREAGDPLGEVRGRFYIAQIHLDNGRLAEAQELFRVASAGAAQVGQPWAPYGFDARYYRAVTAYMRGRWDEALEVADIAGESPPADLEAMLLTVGMLVGAGRGDDSVLTRYERLKPVWPREGLVALNAGAAAVDLHGARGDLEGMWRVLDEVVASLSQTWTSLFQARLRLSVLVLGQLGTAAAVASAHDRAALLSRVPELLEAMEGVRRRTADRPRGFGPEGRAWLARGRAEELRLRWLTGSEPPDGAALVVAWAESVEAFDVLGQVHEAARSRTRLAAALRAAGRPGEAVAAADLARRAALDLGARPVLGELAASEVHGRRTGAGDAGTAGDLTPREHEILALVALGRSNGEIAKQLFISTKTVSVHVSNVLAKLGAGGRTEAVAIARRRGVLVD